MSETTRIITAKITYIEKTENICSKEDDAEISRSVIKDMLNADDVVIDSVQDFVMDEKEKQLPDDFEVQTMNRFGGVN